MDAALRSTALICILIMTLFAPRKMAVHVNDVLICDCLYWCVQCSEKCGGGQRSRVVVCLSADTHDLVAGSLCNMTARPTDVERCNLHPCGTGRRSCLSIVHTCLTD